MKSEDRWPSIRHPLGQFSREVDRLFNELIHRPWGSGEKESFWNPSVDLYETADAFLIEVDLPGMKREDVELKIEGTDLVLSGSRTYEIEETGRYHHQERYQGSFERRMKLPPDVRADEIEAGFEEGVLKIVIPKKKAKDTRKHP